MTCAVCRHEYGNVCAANGKFRILAVPWRHAAHSRSAADAALDDCFVLLLLQLPALLLMALLPILPPALAACTIL